MERKENFSRLYQKNSQLTNKSLRRLTELREQIKNGKGTLGSKLKDFCVVYLHNSPEITERFYKLDSDLRNSGGEEILIIKKQRRKVNLMESYDSISNVLNVRDGFLPPYTTYETDSTLALGALTGKGLDFDIGKMDIIFPTGRKGVKIISKSDNFLFPTQNSSISRIRGRISLPILELPHLYTSQEFYAFQELKLFFAPGFYSDILLGEKVEEYFCGKVDEGIKIQELDEGKKVYSEVRRMLKLS